MKVYNIGYNPSVSFSGRTQSKSKTQSAAVQVNPLSQGINTASAWFGFGVALDYVSRKFSFFKSPMKNSLVINGTIGAAAGVFTGYKAINHKDI